MKIIPIPAFSDNYIWAICDLEAGVFYCVDPGDAKPVLHFAAENQLNLRAILITHHHLDHIGGIAELIKKFPDCIVYGPVDARIPYINYPVKADQIIQIRTLYFKILFNPGHTSTHISYYEPKRGWLFCGDTLFSAGCGRVFDGTIEELHQSMQLFKSLPSATKIFCAHEYTLQNLDFAKTVEPMNLSVQNYIKKLVQESIQCTLPSTLSTELLINPFLRTNMPEVQEFARIHGALPNDSLAIFSVLRKEKNSPSSPTKKTT